MTRLEDLTPEQKEVVNAWGKGLAVLAGAGSGKTTTLVIKCEELLKLEPGARFAAVSFTERSASDLRAKLSERLSLGGEGGALSGHWVMTIHGLCGAILREYPREAGFDGEESMLSEAESQLLWERAMETLWQDDLPPEIQGALDALLERESRDNVNGLLLRARSLAPFGVLARLSASDDPASRALERLSAHVCERYDRMKRRRGALDFDDLERGADRALEHESVREAYRRRFGLVLIDEFQDTNPLQARIILRFARADLSNLCVVGDPKQSIYRFRDADVSVFEEFCSRMPERKSLTWNFRSRPPIIKYANRLCALAFEASGMVYEELEPHRDPGEGDSVLRLDVRSPTELAAWVKAEERRGVPLHEMALLMRKIRGNEKWLKALTSAGVNIAVGSGGLFWEDPRVRELVAFLKWWNNPANSLSGAAFLRAPWVGIPDELLDRWVREDPTWQKPFFASTHPLARALKGYRGRIARPGELLMALLDCDGEVSRKLEDELGAQCLGLWHRVEELSTRGLDAASVVSELATSLEESRREREVPPPRNLGQLSVLTLHGSKGLEFPHVILIDLGVKGRGADAPLLFWDRERGAYLSPRDADGERDPKDPVEASWREQEKKKELAESKRLFYVALTRARERLILACPELPEGKNEFDPEKVFDQDHWRGWVECCGVELPRLAPTAGAEERGEAAKLEPAPDTDRREARVPRGERAPSPGMVRPRHSVTEWTMLSRCPRAYEWSYIRPKPVAEGIEQLGLFTGDKVESAAEEELTQRELGTRVHACMERGDYDGLKAIEREAGPERFAADPVISWAMSSDWMRPGGPGRDRQVWTELAFETPVGREVLVGSIDRLVAEGDRYSIIDFKITGKPKSVEALLEAYGTQMELYAFAVRALQGEKEAAARALLVNISSKTIQTVPVEIGGIDVPGLAAQASAIVNGAAGAPRPGPLCKVCEFRGACPEGSRIGRP